MKNDSEWKAVQSIGLYRFIDVNNEIATIAGKIRLEQRQEVNRKVKAPDSLIIACRRGVIPTLRRRLRRKPLVLVGKGKAQEA